MQSAAPIQIVSPSPGGAGHFAALRRSILSASASRNFASRKSRRRMRQPRRIGDDAVAHAERALGRLDEAMRELEALGLADAQALVQREDDERRQPLRRRRRVVDRAGVELDAQRLGDARADSASDPRASPGCRSVPDRRRSRGRHRRDRNRRARRAPDDRASTASALCLSVVPASGGLPSGRNVSAKPGTSFSSASFSAVSRAWLLGHHIAVARLADRGVQQHVERQPCRRPRLRRLERQHPAADRARHGERGERPARGDRLVLAIKLRRGARAGRARPP